MVKTVKTKNNTLEWPNHDLERPTKNSSSKEAHQQNVTYCAELLLVSENIWLKLLLFKAK